MTNRDFLLLALACLTTILGFEAGRRFERNRPLPVHFRTSESETHPIL